MMKPTKNSVKSSWTPLTNEEANKKMFDERRMLVGKWFDKWTDAQRRVVLQDLLAKCKLKQIEFANDLVIKKMPVYHDDFTRHLPRVLSLYIFSFLDPRSLCRTSQVCFHWKSLTEVDQLWLPKCIRLGWILPFSPSPYESGVWKRFYIENVSQLKAFQPKIPLSELEKYRANQESKDTARSTSRRTPRPRSALSTHPGTTPPNKRPPWKGSDTTPKDIWRNNYLENDDEVEKVNKLRKKGMAGTETMKILKETKSKVNTGSIYPEYKPSAMPRSRSVGGLHEQQVQPKGRPDWAKPASVNINNNSKVTNGTATKTVTIQRPSAADTGHKSSPMKATIPSDQMQKPKPRAPSPSDVFPDQPWVIADDYDSDT